MPMHLASAIFFAQKYMWENVAEIALCIMPNIFQPKWRFIQRLCISD